MLRAGGVGGMSPGVFRRPATDGDDAFLYELFKAVRAPDFALAALTPIQLDTLLRIQYAGQKHTYGLQCPDFTHEIILMREDDRAKAIAGTEGQRVGRIWISRGPAEHRLVDIALLPAFQNRGIGAALVKEAILHASEAGLPMCCSVGLSNAGSLRFHQRLGFRIVSQDEVYYELRVEGGPPA